MKPCSVFKQIFVIAMFFICTTANSQTFNAGFSASTIASSCSQPVGAAFNKTGTKLFIWEKGGKVYVCNWNNATQLYDKQSTAVLDISEEVGNWRDHGMLGFALDPNYDINGYIYLLYVVDRHHLINYGTATYNAATNDYFKATIGRITRYKLITNSGNLLADVTTRTILLGESKSTGFPILHESHGIGSLVFASDGTLLAGCGDASSYNTTDGGNLAETYQVQSIADGNISANENVGAFKAQMINSLAGKLIRIDPATGNGVSSNPFYETSNPRSAKSRMWTMGLRNPFRFCARPGTGSTNPATGDIGELYIGDVGWGTFEELNIIKAPASNCGWPIFEGLKYLNSYAIKITDNKDEPNPLFGIGGCSQQYFTFQNLIKQATADNINNVYNPCNLSSIITSGNNRRNFHRVPALDWKHGVDSARVKIFNGNILEVAQIGSPISGVTGTPFRGNAAAGTCWYTGTMFPLEYRNTCFQADYGGNWIKSITIQNTDQVQKVTQFGSGFAAIVCITENPLDGSMVIVDLGNNTVKKIVYGGNQSPVTVLSSNQNYGPSALLVNFTGSNSYDPGGGPITYSWNFGDPTSGNNTSIAINPSHTFTTLNSNPKKYIIKLTVTDNQSASTIDSMIISVNNTPPIVNITSPVKNSFYSLGADTIYSLNATVTDAEHGPGQLTYKWQTFLRHNNHKHAEPVDTNKITAELISRIGCNGDNYYWQVNLTVTDAAGLSTVDSSKIFPDCNGGPLPIILSSFTIIQQNNTNILNWITESEINMKWFDVERSYDGVNFDRIGTLLAKRAQGLGSYEWKDDNHSLGYNYYRLKMIDIGGNFKYSFIVRVFTGKWDSNEILVTPNPVMNNSVIIGSNFLKSEKIQIQIIDIKGSVVIIQNEVTRPGYNSFKIENLQRLSTGIYFAEIIFEGGKKITRLIKSR
jgi:glucose/arabinose dehydrogenase